MIEILQFIRDFSLMLTAAAFMVYTICVARVTSFSLICFAVVPLHIIHQRISTLVKPFWGVADFEPYIHFMWYLPFAITDLFFVWFCSALIKRYDILRDRITTTILGIYLFLGIYQFAAFLDWQCKLFWLYDFTPYVIPTLNMTMTVLMCCMAMRVAWLRCKPIANKCKFYVIQVWRAFV